MARKKKHPEHVNLERYLISYADFITLLFATFVVLYALSQVDIKDFKSLEESMRQAFASPSITQGSEGVLSTSDSVFDNKQADSMITPLMMEYISQKYEQESMTEIEKQIENLVKNGRLDGVEAIREDRGLVIKFNDDYLFKSGSAVLTPSAKLKLDLVGATIFKKFVLHNMRVEGHTDNKAIQSIIYPSNWELSSARASSIIRYFIERFKFMPSLFTAVGFADTRPISDNNSPQAQARNRRVEIVILKNKFKSQESPQESIVKLNKAQQEIMQNERMNTINKIENMSDAAKNIAKNDKEAEQKAIILNQSYEKEINRLSKQVNVFDDSTKMKVTGQGTWLKPPGKKDSKDIRQEINNEFKGIK